MLHIAIIGAGASGLFLAQKLTSRHDVSVHLFEKARQVGTKLRASGGGKANLFNQQIPTDCYNRPDFIATLLERVTPQRLHHEFGTMGLALMADNEGRVYPLSQFSQTVVDVLLPDSKSNCHIETEYEVRRLSQEHGKWRINDYPMCFDRVVIATGSPANIIPRNSIGYNGFLTDFNFQTAPLKPSLVGFRIADYPKTLSGCRVKVLAALYQGKRLIHEEAGEVTFKDDGISGIVMMNLSARYNRLQSKQDCHIQLNFMYQDPDYDVEGHLRRHHSLKGLLHPKLNELYEKRPFDVKKCKFSIIDTYGMEHAQVCHGGIDLSEVSGQFEILRYPGLFATGEVLDIDGVCGGYNLFFAFASALIVAEAINEA